MSVIARNWVIAVAVLASVAMWIYHYHDVRTDLTFFLPDSRTEDNALMSSFMRNAQGGSMIMVGIEGAAPPVLAEASRDLAQAMESSGHYNFVANGRPTISAQQLAQAKDWRYLIGPDLAQDTFEVPALTKGLGELSARLAAARGWAFRDTVAWDPFGRMEDLLDFGTTRPRPERRHGVWMNKDGSRALIFANAKASADDIFQQISIQETLDDAMSPWREKDVRFLASGPGLFAVDIRERIHSEMRVLSVVATAIVLAVLWVSFRSLSAILALAVPLAAGVLAGVVAVQLAFGSIHGVALTFGLTLIGVAADYPIHVLSHRRAAESARQSAHRLWRPLSLSAGTTAAVFFALSPSSFSGLAQMGVLVGVGILTAASVSYWAMPHLVWKSRPLDTGRWASLVFNNRLLLGVRASLAIFALIAIAGMALSPVPLWLNNLSDMSPLSEENKAIDRALRTDLHASDTRHIITVGGPDGETVLQRQEALRPSLDALVADGSLGGYTMAADILPSQAAQRARQQAMPDAETLKSRLAQADSLDAFQRDAFAPFVQDIARARIQPPVSAQAFLDSALGWRLSPLLQPTGLGTWRGVIMLTPPMDLEAIGRLDSPAGPVRHVDLKALADDIVVNYREEAFRWLGAGALAAIMFIAFGLRDVGRTVRAILPAASAIGLTLAFLSATGVSLSLFHILALLLVAGIGVDYALFFNTFRGTQKDLVQNLRAIALCNATTISVFSVLAASSTLVLSAIGSTVAIGAGLSFAFTYAFGLGYGER